MVVPNVENSLMRPGANGKDPLILSNSNAQFLLSRESWERTLNLAALYGWTGQEAAAPPAGDRTPSPEYLFDEAERVAAIDCHAIAAAIDRALPDIPDHDARLEGGDSAAYSVYFSGIGKLWLRALAAFCRSGSFFVRSVSVAGESGEGYRAA